MKVSNAMAGFLVFTLAVLMSWQAAAQNQQAQAFPPPPPSDIYLMSIERLDDTFKFTQLINITDRDGYDNQPHFSPDGKTVFYTSMIDNQADIYTYDLASGRVRKFTDTPESEYSPTVMPGNNAVSTVRVESDGTQRLWQFNLDGSNPRPVFLDIVNVGYHCWLDNEKAALFIVGDPVSLHIADRVSGRVEVLAENIGRSLIKFPGNASVLVYIDKDQSEQWWVNSLDFSSREITALIPALEGSEDIAWLPDGSLLMAKGKILYRWPGKSNTVWQPVIDLSDQLQGEISRLAVNQEGNRLAMVVSRP
ncbi:MAG: hypothetical protein MJA83_10110 [Gammaproteobacteria bacterium]|nr:hypothetical protein [Gammaproteobacteria bacterium]